MGQERANVFLLKKVVLAECVKTPRSIWFGLWEVIPWGQQYSKLTKKINL
jgi:hypothetical protein